ncbi:hypothetical protein SAMN05421749_102296 [Acinetobacter marinus]|uniref:DUF1285 domain-containing protein n=1 Tax=Acinetobacter marinus TaxID=281375 RepID=A0A1G6HIY3_9GAMM|nr:hypothetical protein SAMN05421749_102296 [Acinetobacter marinus]
MAVQANFENIASYLQQFSHDRSIPPLEKWNPDYCGEMDLVIKANGEWWHEGRPIRRQKMVDLFAKILWKEQDDYFLKTPVEKIKIQVEDAPLLISAVDQVEIDGKQYLQMTTQNQDVFVIDAEHPIYMRAFDGEMRPYVKVRYELEALVQRNVFYHLVNYGELYDEPNCTCLKLHSGDAQFTLCM